MMDRGTLVFLVTFLALAVSAECKGSKVSKAWNNESQRKGAPEANAEVKHSLLTQEFWTLHDQTKKINLKNCCLKSYSSAETRWHTSLFNAGFRLKSIFQAEQRPTGGHVWECMTVHPQRGDKRDTQETDGNITYLKDWIERKKKSLSQKQAAELHSYV